MEEDYLNGGYGYGHAKKALFELTLDKFKKERNKFRELLQQSDLIEKELQRGSEKAKEIANSVLIKVKRNLGLMRA